MMTTASPIASFVESLRSPQILFPNLMAAALLAIMNVTTAISVAALVFSGVLTPYLSTGIGLFLVGTAVGGALVAAGSGFKGVVAGPRSGQAPLMAAMAAAIAISMGGQPIEAISATVVVSILVATIFIGIVLFGLGWARLGVMVRYIPYPVMGGFFAGLGFLLAKGGILVTLGPLVSTSDPASFLTLNTALHLAPALLFAVLYYAVEQRFNHWLLMPGFLIVFLVLFYGVLFATGTSTEMATQNYWLPAIDTTGSGFFPVLTLDQLALVSWPAVFSQTGTILVMALMSMIMLLLDVSGIEIVLDRDLDPNHELKVAGAAGVVTGLCTGPIAIQAAGGTAFTCNLGGDRYIKILAYAAFVIGAIIVGPGPIAYVPTAILGGLLIYIGIGFLVTWVWQTRKKLPWTDYAVVCGILFVVAVQGILQGVAVGIIMAILLFVHSYSKLSVIKSSMSGVEHISNVDRNLKERKHLDEHGAAIHIFVLQGFLFFGTASRLLEDIRALLDDPSRPKTHYLVLDFRRVSALDTSAANSFAKLMQICRKDGLALIFTGCSPEISTRLKTLADDDGAPVSQPRHFPELDDGVAWSEDDMLHEFQSDDADDDPVRLLTEILGDEEAARTISDKFAKVSVSGGQTLFAQGDPGDALYLVLSGAASIVLNLPNGNILHLRTMRTGAVFGEMALYTGAPRSASALVKSDSFFCRLDQTSFDDLSRDFPAEAGLFHAFIVRLMAERLGRAAKEIMALSR